MQALAAPVAWFGLLGVRFIQHAASQAKAAASTHGGARGGGSAAAAEQHMRDPGVGRVMMLLPTVTIALMGIGSLEPSALLRESGNMTTAEDAVELRAEGAVCSMATIRR